MKNWSQSLFNLHAVISLDLSHVGSCPIFFMKSNIRRYLMQSQPGGSGDLCEDKQFLVWLESAS